MSCIKGSFVLHAALKCVGLFVLSMCALVYSSLGFAAGCSTAPVYITPTPSQLQGAVNAASKGGMLSSAWHETLFLISCEGMSKDTGTLYFRSYPDSMSGSTTFEGETYGLYPTANLNIFMMVSIESGSRFVPVKSQQEIPLPKVGQDGSLRHAFRVRIRYFSDSKLAAGVRVLNQHLVFRNVPGYYVSSVGGYTCNPATGLCGSNLGPIVVKSFSLKVNDVSCTLDAPSQVNLNSVNLALLSTQGTTAPGASFQLGVSCNKTYVGYRVLYDMVDVNDPGNRSTNLTLAKLPEHASGVALQVLDEGRPLNFGLNDSPSLIGAMGAEGGMLKKMLSVRYIRTGAEATPGKVNAGVSVTLSYD